MKTKLGKRIIVMLLTCILGLMNAIPTNVQAASKITLKSGSAAPSTVYVGKTYSLKVAGTKVKFYSNKKSVATIGLTTGKLKPIAPGTVTITAKSTKTGKVVASKKFTVNQRATSVSSNQSELILAVNATATLKATKTPATSTDAIKYESDNKAVATVGLSSGKVTARSNGVATITIYSTATKSTKTTSSANKKTTVKVYVGPFLDKADQVEATKIQLTFKSDMVNLKATDFKVVRDETGSVIPVESVEISKEDKKIVTLNVFEELKDAKTYTVTYGDQKVQFTATDGKIASININPTAVPINTDTIIYAEGKDANGVIVKKVTMTTNDSYLEFKLSNINGGFTSEDKLTLFTVGNTATASATYRTFNYDDKGNEIGVIKTGDVKITAVDKAIVIDYYKYTIDKKDKVIDFDKLAEKNASIAVGDEDYAFHLQILDSTGKEITNYTDYYFESSNKDIFDVTDVSTDGKAVGINPINPGVARLVIINKKNNIVVKTSDITVIAKREPTSMKFSKLNEDQTDISFIEVNQSIVKQEAATVIVRIIDQYGKELDEKDIYQSYFSIKDITKNANQCLMDECIKQEGKKLTIYSANSPITTNVYEISYQIASGKSLTKQFRITYNVPSGAERKKLVVGDLLKDSKALDKLPDEKTFVLNGDINIKGVYIATYKGGVPVSIQNIQDVSGVTVKLSGSNNEDVTEKYYKDGTIKIDSVDSYIRTTMPCGKYKVTLSSENSSLKDLSYEFELKEKSEVTSLDPYTSLEYWTSRYGDAWDDYYVPWCDRNGLVPILSR